MNEIEIRLDPEIVSALMDTVRPAIESLRDELASPALLPEEDEVMEDFWKSDLLESQRNEIDVVLDVFGDEFLNTGRAIVKPENMDRMIRSCSAIRLKLRDTVLGELDDSQLEEGNLEGVSWTKERQLGYGAYSLFASLQELIISQMNDEAETASDDDDENPYV